MPVFTASTAITAPLLAPGHYRRGQYKGQNKQTGCCPVKYSMQTQPFNPQRGHIKLAVSGPVGSAIKLQAVNKRTLNFNRKQSVSMTCAAALSARCAASGQTQTLKRESPGVTKAPQRETNKTPRLDDGGPGLPPYHRGGWGGGGGGGGGKFSGGFFLFGFLGFLGYLKDLETESKESRM